MFVLRDHVRVSNFQFRFRLRRIICLTCDELSRVVFDICGLEFSACPPLSGGLVRLSLAG